MPTLGVYKDSIAVHLSQRDSSRTVVVSFTIAIARLASHRPPHN